MTAPAELRETHISVVTMIGDRAYKLLKPVETGFLDHRRREDRLAACRRETEVNRRFAPDVYLGVLDVLDGAGEALDHLIAMRRMPSDRALSRLLDEPQAEGIVREVARLVAGFHRHAPASRVVARAGRPATVRALWDEGLDGLERAAPGVVPPGQVARARTLAHEYIGGRRPLFERRIAEGWIRDGHGDLLADDVYVLDDGPRILDALAFDDRLRHGDVLLDIAFLAMDLERRGHLLLAEAAVAEWSAALAEDHPSSLRDHYVAYRAHVRSKVAAIRASQGDAAAAAEARALHALVLHRLERARVRLILVGGLPGTGKSTLAEGLARETGARVLRSDALRKSMAGVPLAMGAAAPFEEGLYQPETTARVYEELLAQAGPLLSQGETVVLDASWTHAPWRREARRLARLRGACIVELRCEVPDEVARARMAARHGAGGDPSDATPDVADRMHAAADPWPEAIAMATRAAAAEVVAAARTVIRKR